MISRLFLLVFASAVAYDAVVHQGRYTTAAWMTIVETFNTAYRATGTGAGTGSGTGTGTGTGTAE